MDAVREKATDEDAVLELNTADLEWLDESRDGLAIRLGSTAVPAGGFWAGVK